MPSAPSIQISSLVLISYASVASTPRRPKSRWRRIQPRQVVARETSTVANSSISNTRNIVHSVIDHTIGIRPMPKPSIRAATTPTAIRR